MRIAQVAPLFESVPPQWYGGTERVVSYLTEALVEAGHEVTLYATGDSRTRARLRAVAPRALRLDSAVPDAAVYQALQLEWIADEAGQYDVIHFHNEPLHLPLTRRLGVPFVHTMHNRCDTPELGSLFQNFSEAPLVSISDSQRADLPHANWLKTIYHGLPPELFSFQAKPGAYLAFLGRMSPEKQVHQAIEIARRAGMPIKIAAKIEHRDIAYYENVVRPLLEHPDVDYVGEIGGAEKNEFLGNAAALVFPIDWPEPFGLVMVEAMACGTPVVAYGRGSVPEIVEEGVTGFIVDDLEHAVSAIGRLQEIDRRACRDAFDARFSAYRMTDDYLSLFERLCEPRSARSLICERL